MYKYLSLFIILFILSGCEKTTRNIKNMEDTGYVIYANKDVDQSLEYNPLFKQWLPTTNISYESKIHFNSLGIDYENDTMSMYNICKNLQHTPIKISYQLIAFKSDKIGLTKKTDINILNLRPDNK